MHLTVSIMYFGISLVALVVKNTYAIAGSIRDETRVQSLAQEYSSAGGHGNPLQYYCLENPMGRGV